MIKRRAFLTTLALAAGAKAADIRPAGGKINRARINYDSSFSPDSISGLKLWLKADSLALSDNDAVASWTDSSGLGNHAVQATEAKKPIFKTAIVNGKPVIRFDGIDDNLVAPVSGVTSAYTVIAVVSLIAAGNFPMLVTWGDSAHELRCESTTKKPELLTTAVALATSPTALVLSAFNILTGRHATDGTIFVDGVLKDTEATIAAVATTSVFIGSRAGASLFANADFAEVLIYDTGLSTANRQAVEAYLKQKYGL